MAKKQRQTWKPKRKVTGTEAALEPPPPPEPALPPLPQAVERAAWAVLGVGLLFLLWHVWRVLSPLIGLPWYNSSDETVVAGEVIRFATRDYRQQFFDMPGTPLMLLGTLEWRLYFRFAGEAGQDILSFTFAHLQQLLAMLRATSMAFFLASVVVLYALAARVTNRFAALIACAVFALNGAYGVMLTFLRVEPITTFLVLLAALLVVLRLRWYTALAAGLLAGVAAGCRIHSITLSVPLLVLLVWTRTWRRSSDYSRVVRGLFAALAVVLAAGGGYLYWRLAFTEGQHMKEFPLAYAFLARVCLAAALAVVAAVALYSVGRVRAWVVNAVTPEIVLIGVGLAGAFLASTFTVFGQWRYFLRSLDFYNGPGYQDPAVLRMAPLEKVTSLVTFYMKFVVQDYTIAVLLAAGVAVAIFVPKWRHMLVWVAVAFSFFFTRPINLQRARHHIALWVPIFAIVCAAGPAALLDLAEWRLQARRYLAWAAAVVVLLALPFLLRDGARDAWDGTAGAFERLHNVAQSRQWMAANIPKGSDVQLAFYCFGPETFYNWFRDAEVPVPPMGDDAYRFGTWWGQRPQVKGRAGYACFAPELDVPYMKHWDLQTPGLGIDPLHEPGFRHLQTFGKGQNAVAFYQFDLR